MESTHQLAAIMFTDIVGYTTMMAQDQKKAMELVEQNRSIQKPIIEKHSGTWHKEMGDGSLISFKSAIEAVQCAIEIQEAAHKTPDLLLRIGIHLGDVTFKENDVFGDGVNISSRIESIADPGGIYISESVSKAIKGRTVIQTQFLGEFFLKHVDEPVKIFALRGEGMPEPSKNYQADRGLSFWTLLQQRNVLRAGLTYLILALLLYQLVRYFLSDLDPALILGVLGIGFLIAIYMAWNYEFSPKGLVRTQSKEAVINPYSSTQKKPFTNNLVIGVLVGIIAIMYIFPDQLGITGIANPETTPNTNSIAVMPFVNMSGDEEQEYFSDGLSEELINALVKVPGLKVAGRTSAFSYKGKDVNLTRIGRELGVANILQGSVRKSGDQIRVTAQLINAEDGFNIWADTYNRKLTDIFAIQDEITNSIMKALEVHLEGEEPILIEAIETDLNAYETYLQARKQLALREDHLLEARKLFEEVVSIDPDYAPAYAGLGKTLALGRNWTFDFTYYESTTLAKEAANMALKLDPNNAEAYSTLGAVAVYGEWDWKTAKEAHSKSLEINPNDAEIYNFFGDYYTVVSDYTMAKEMKRKAIELDPLHVVNYQDMANILIMEKDWEEALRYANAGREITDLPNFYLIMFQCYLAMDSLTKAEEMVNQFNDYESNPITQMGRWDMNALLSIYKGETDISKQYLDSLASFQVNGIQPYTILAVLNLELVDYEKAASLLEKAYESRDVFLVYTSPITLPELLPDHPSIRMALDKPELNELWEIRRKNLGLVD